MLMNEKLNLKKKQFISHEQERLSPWLANQDIEHLRLTHPHFTRPCISLSCTFMPGIFSFMTLLTREANEVTL